jgi:hypothetical protein
MLHTASPALLGAPRAAPRSRTCGRAGRRVSVSPLAATPEQAAELASLESSRQGLAKVRGRLELQDHAVRVAISADAANTQHLAAASSSASLSVPVEDAEGKVAEAAVAETAGRPLPLADSSTFYPWLEAAGDALVVVDFYTGALRDAANRGCFGVKRRLYG